MVHVTNLTPPESEQPFTTVNVAAIGCVCRQLHVHVLGRFEAGGGLYPLSSVVTHSLQPPGFSP
jgi:hypothetical protein